MALQLIRCAGRTPAALFLPLSSYHPKTRPLSSYHPKTLIQCPSPHQPPVEHKLDPPSPQSRTFVSEMRKSAFDDHILKLVSNDIQYELDRSPLTQLVPKFRSFAIDERAGEQWIKLNKKFGDDEEIRIEATMFGTPSKDADVVAGNDLELYISMVINIFKDKRNGMLEFVCHVWPDSMEIDKVLMPDQEGMAGRPYRGPPFDDLDGNLQTSLYDFLERRGINDELAVFLHKCMQQKHKIEYVRWMESVKSFVAQKV